MSIIFSNETLFAVVFTFEIHTPYCVYFSSISLEHHSNVGKNRELLHISIVERERMY